MEKNQTNKSKRTRKKILFNLVGFLGLVLTSISLGVKKFQDYHQDFQTDHFGTRENPAYTVNKSINEQDTETYSSFYGALYEKRIKDLEIALREYKSDPKLKSNLEQLLKQINDEDQRLMEEYQLVFLRNQDNQLNADSENNDSVAKRAKTLFLSMTGKEYPPEIKLRLGRPIINGEEVQGGYQPTKRRITVYPSNFEDTLLSSMHEIGHSIEAHTKDRLFGNHSYEEQLMSEASAYCFQNASCYFEDPKTRKLMLQTHRIELFEDVMLSSRGRKDYRIEAMILSDAATTHFGNPVTAFQYLQKTPYRELDPDILHLMQRNKSIFLRQNQLKTEAENILRAPGN
ncbi:MAG: hypothetical protein PHF67_01630 [Candidatus Nanoarchaeia archaeon]|nr:hypothetical protein [Candidatus Nanoarchaeia archaeon]